MSRWGDNIIRLRKLRGVGQVALAKTAGVDKSTLNRIETGEDYKPTLEKLLKIAKALDSDIAELFTLPRPEGSGHATAVNVAGGGTRIEDHIGAVFQHLGTLDSKARGDFIRALVTLLDALEHARPAASSGTPPNDGP